jgi:uncharacterized membrane protein YccC
MKFLSWWRETHWLRHIVRTTLGAMVSLAVASLFALPQAYWSAITTLIVLQSTLDSAIAISAKRLVGTAMGVVLGAALYVWLGPTIWAFGLGLVVGGLACTAVAHSFNKLSGFVDRTAYRYAGITLAVVLLIPHTRGIWTIALDRFIEVSIGIIVGLAFTKLWPERSEQAGVSSEDSAKPEDQGSGAGD